MFEAGCEPARVFLFSDTQIVKESFLEDINNILNPGEVPNMMETEDMERILAAVRPLAKAAGKSESRDAIYAHFVQLVRENLHIVLCIPVGDARVRCRMFLLINCRRSTGSTWPKDALLAARVLLRGRRRGAGDQEGDLRGVRRDAPLVGRPPRFLRRAPPSVTTLTSTSSCSTCTVDARRAAEIVAKIRTTGRRQARRHERWWTREEGAGAIGPLAQAGEDTRSCSRRWR